MRTLCILAALAILASYARADMGRFTPADKRLDKKITLDMDHARLEDVAKSIREQTGVTVKAGTGDRDWKVCQQQVSIHAKDVPLDKMLDQITKVVSFCISREGKENEWVYTIWQDKKARDLEAEMLNAQREEATQRVAKSREGTIDLAKDALAMSPEEALKQKDKNPVLAYMGGTKTGRGFSSFLTYFQANFPTEYDLMLRGKRVSVPLSGLPANMQQAVTDMTSGGMAGAIKDQIVREQKNAADALPELTPFQMLFQPANEKSGADVESLGFGGLIFLTGVGPDGRQFDTEFGGGIPMSACALTDPSSVLGKAIGDMLVSIENGTPLDEANKSLNERVDGNPEFVMDILTHESPTEKNTPTDPELTREVEIKDVMGGAGGQAFMGKDADKYARKILAEISRAIGSPVIKEHYNSEMVAIGLFVHPGKQPLYKILIGLEKSGCVWAREDGALRIRPSDWSLLRSYQIPESYMTHYRDLIEKEGQLNINDVSAIAASLTDGQLDHTFLTNPDFAFLASALSGRQGSGNRGVLRFYASLSPKQQEAIAVAPGLAFGQLTDAQWELLSESVTDRFGGSYITDGSIFLKPQNETEINIGSQSRAFEITAQIQNEKEPRKFTMAMYMPGKKQIAEIRAARKKAEEEARKDAEKRSEQPAKP